MAIYQRRTLVPPADVGLPAPLPPELVGLDQVSLDDLEVAIGVAAATQLGFLNTAFLPVADPVVTPLVSAGALRVALRRAGLLNDFNSAVNALSQEFKLWWDHQPSFPLNDLFITAVLAQAGAPLSTGYASAFTVAESAHPT